MDPDQGLFWSLNRSNGFGLKQKYCNHNPLGGSTSTVVIDGNSNWVSVVIMIVIIQICNRKRADVSLFTLIHAENSSRQCQQRRPGLYLSTCGAVLN